MGGTCRAYSYVGAGMGNILSKRAWILINAILGDSLSGKGESNMKYDVVVIGGGLAGLRAAIEAQSKGASVLVVSKASNSKALTIPLPEA